MQLNQALDGKLVQSILWWNWWREKMEGGKAKQVRKKGQFWKCFVARKSECMIFSANLSNCKITLNQISSLFSSFPEQKPPCQRTLLFYFIHSDNFLHLSYEKRCLFLICCINGWIMNVCFKKTSLEKKII